MVGNNDGSGSGGNKPQGRRGSKKRGSSSRGKGSSGNDADPGGRSFPVVSDSRFSSMHSAPVSLGVLGTSRTKEEGGVGIHLLHV